MGLTPTEQLDAVLDCFKDKTQLHPQNIQTQLSTIGIELDSQYVVEILHKLQKDGYTRFVSGEHKSRDGKYLGNYNAWFITFEGHLLRQTGGYKTKFLNEDAEIALAALEVERLKTVDRQGLSNADRLNRLTKGLVIATVLLILVGIATIFWDAVKFCFEHHCNIQDVLKTI
jgi:hypothetical protein